MRATIVTHGGSRLGSIEGKRGKVYRDLFWKDGDSRECSLGDIKHVEVERAGEGAGGRTQKMSVKEFRKFCRR